LQKSVRRIFFVDQSMRARERTLDAGRCKAARGSAG